MIALIEGLVWATAVFDGAVSIYDAGAATYDWMTNTNTQGLATAPASEGVTASQATLDQILRVQTAIAQHQGIDPNLYL